MKNNNFIELIELYEELVNVVCDLGTLPKSKKHILQKHLVEKRTQLLVEIEDQRNKLQINQI